MRKLLVLVFAISLFTACNNNNPFKKDNNKERDNTGNNRDDYRNGDDNNKNNNDDRGNNRNSDYNDDNGGGSWSATERKTFTSNCVDEAVKGGFSNSKAEDYCSCMQEKLERKFPNTRDVADLDMNTPEMKRMVKDCLGMGNNNDDGGNDGGSYNNSGGSGWTRSEENKFVDDCVGTAKQNVGLSRATDYCNCMLDKVKRLYSTYSEAERELGHATQDDIRRLAAGCNE